MMVNMGIMNASGVDPERKRLIRNRPMTILSVLIIFLSNHRSIIRPVVGARCEIPVGRWPNGILERRNFMIDSNVLVIFLQMSYPPIKKLVCNI